ncbi:low molecular weight phosphotyrosine protein phosphatase [Zooshikella sp. WH53]|uniref:protein-tyrosine-phosphatase n=2 Tax=Zooshikella harenae TaxID=2827238 RepID=A0ABS5ZBW4_9GAMM|nr:low molecular weight phosphotyrosine protein phosphatase [Zooshikella harenae]
MFVCLGNICRSPTAHGVFQSMVESNSLADTIEVASAGTSAYHIGEQPDARSQQVAAARGYDLSMIRAQQFNLEDFFSTDFVLAMDKSNLACLRELCPQGYEQNLQLFLNYSGVNQLEVPDPYYGGPDGFSDVLDLVEQGARGLLQHICQQYRIPL